MHGTAACFYCAAFYGIYEVAKLHQAGIRRITLIDIDRLRIEHMKGVYPGCLEIVEGDAIATAEHWLANGRRFDIVTCDPWSSLQPNMVTDLFATFRNLATRLYIAGVNGDMVRELASDLSVSAMSKSLAKRHGYPVKVFDVMMRNPEGYAGGAFWVVTDGGGSS